MKEWNQGREKGGREGKSGRDELKEELRVRKKDYHQVSGKMRLGGGELKRREGRQGNESFSSGGKLEPGGRLCLDLPSYW